MSRSIQTLLTIGSLATSAIAVAVNETTKTTNGTGLFVPDTKVSEYSDCVSVCGAFNATMACLQNSDFTDYNSLIPDVTGTAANGYGWLYIGYHKTHGWAHSGNNGSSTAHTCNMGAMWDYNNGAYDGLLNQPDDLAGNEYCAAVHRNYKITESDGTEIQLCNSLDKWCDIPCCSRKKMECGSTTREEPCWKAKNAHCLCDNRRYAPDDLGAAVAAVKDSWCTESGAWGMGLSGIVGLFASLVAVASAL